MEKAALQERWDKLNLSTMTGTYGSYLLLKVSKVFPALAKLRLGGNVMA